MFLFFFPRVDFQIGTTLHIDNEIKVNVGLIEMRVLFVLRNSSVVCIYVICSKKFLVHRIKGERETDLNNIFSVKQITSNFVLQKQYIFFGCFETQAISKISF